MTDTCDLATGQGGRWRRSGTEGGKGFSKLIKAGKSQMQKVLRTPSRLNATRLTRSAGQCDARTGSAACPLGGHRAPASALRPRARCDPARELPPDPLPDVACKCIWRPFHEPDASPPPAPLPQACAARLSWRPLVAQAPRPEQERGSR